MPFSTYMGNSVIDHYLRNQAFTSPSAVYVALFTADPGLTGENEVSGSSYGRKAVTLSAASNKSTSNSGSLNFPGMPACNVLYAGLWNEIQSGSFLMSGSLSASKVVNAGDSFQFAVSALSVVLT